jgi:hypothetical protein
MIGIVVVVVVVVCWMMKMEEGRWKREDGRGKMEDCMMMMEGRGRSRGTRGVNATYTIYL